MSRYGYNLTIWHLNVRVASLALASQASCSLEGSNYFLRMQSPWQKAWQVALPEYYTTQ